MEEIWQAKLKVLYVQRDFWDDDGSNDTIKVIGFSAWRYCGTISLYCTWCVSWRGEWFRISWCCKGSIWNGWRGIYRWLCMISCIYIHRVDTYQVEILMSWYNNRKNIVVICENICYRRDCNINLVDVLGVFLLYNRMVVGNLLLRWVSVIIGWCKDEC